MGAQCIEPLQYLYYYYFFLLLMVFVLTPVRGICTDVCAYLLQRIVVANDMVVEIALPAKISIAETHQPSATARYYPPFRSRR